MKHKATRPERDKAKKDFYFLLLLWLVLSVFFHLLNISSENSAYWAIYPILSFGVVVAISGIKVFITEMESEKERDHHLYLSDLPNLNQQAFEESSPKLTKAQNVSTDPYKWNTRDFV